MTTSVTNNPGASAGSTAAAGSATAAMGKAMNQADFLKLMTAQLQAQDPTSPLDNSQFVAQLAQFSQLAATQDLSASVNNIGSQVAGSMQTAQVLSSVGLVGRQVMVPSDSIAYTSGTVQGAVGVTGSAAQDVQVAIKDGNGKVVRTLDLGIQAAGLARFQWDGLDDSGSPVAPGSYSVSAADAGGSALSTYAAGTVTGVGYGGSSVGTYVQVAGVGGVPLSAIAQIN